MFDIKSFYEANSVEDAIAALTADPQSQVISGGTDVLIRVREGKDAGRSLVSIHNIPELKGVSLEEDGTIIIRPATSFSHLTNDPIIKKHLNMLGEAVDQVGGPQVRNTATIGGNICNGAFKITRENYEGWEGHYIKYGKRKAMEIATLGCAVRVKLSPDKTVLEDVRLAYGVAAPTPVRCHEAEEALRGKQVSDASIYDLFAEKALAQVNPRTSWRASREFRLQLIGELARRALKTSITLAGGKTDA